MEEVHEKKDNKKLSPLIKMQVNKKTLIDDVSKNHS